MDALNAEKCLSGRRASPAPSALQHFGAPSTAESITQQVRPPASGMEILPIWLSALLATSFQARSSAHGHAVRWDCASGRATYTNAGNEAERIEPLGVCLPGGQTLVVYWPPGGTTYALEVYQSE